MAKYTTKPSPSEERLAGFLEKYGNIEAYTKGAGEGDPRSNSIALYSNAIKSPLDAANAYAAASDRLASINKLLIQAEGEHSDAQKLIKPYLRSVKRRLEATQKRAQQYINVDGVRAELQEHVARMQLVLS